MRPEDPPAVPDQGTRQCPTTGGLAEGPPGAKGRPLRGRVHRTELRAHEGYPTLAPDLRLTFESRLDARTPARRRLARSGIIGRCPLAPALLAPHAIRPLFDRSHARAP
jgi:hypothetical protein